MSLAVFDELLCGEGAAVITPEVTDVKAALTTALTELQLPTVRHCYEETAPLAERETLSYERYLLQLVTRECEIGSGSGSSDC